MRGSKVLRVDSKCPYDGTGKQSVDAVVLVFDVLLFDFETKPKKRRKALLVLMKDTSSTNSSRHICSLRPL